MVEEIKEVEIEKKEIATGIVDVVANKEAIEAIKEVSANYEYPSLFIDDDKKIRVEVDVLFDPSQGKPLLMIGSPQGKPQTELKYLKRVREWMEFTHPNYDDMIFYRENSMSFDKETNQFLADPVKMRLQYIRFHLKDWSLKGSDGKKIELKFDGNRLGEESMKAVGKLMSSLVDIFLSEFEREAMLG